MNGPDGPGRRGSAPAEADRLAADRSTALRLVPVSRETEDRFCGVRRSPGPLAPDDQSHLRIDLPYGLDASHRRQRPASPARPRRDALARHGLRRRISRPRRSDAARRDSGRRGSLRRQRPAQLRVPARSGSSDGRAARHPSGSRRSDRPRGPGSCGLRDRARLRPLARDARIRHSHGWSAERSGCFPADGRPSGTT